MAGKDALIESLEKLLENEDVEAIQEEVGKLKVTYEKLISQTSNTEKPTTDKPTEEGALEVVEEAAAPSDDHEEELDPSEQEETPENTAIESAELQDEEDKKFKLLLDEFNKRRNDLRKKRAEEIKNNLEKAKAVIEKLKKLNSEEENISRSFNKLNELKDTWKAIGTVPKDQYRDLQHEYSQELDIFFYNINIYKELRENDLKRNSAMKRALISDAESLAKENNIKILDQKLKEYQEQWHQIGPTFKEEWEEVRDKFWGAIREAYKKIHDHFQKRREEHEANLQAKTDLVEFVKNSTENEPNDHKAWQKVTESVIEAQGKWRKIGFATKKENDRVWKEFRAACDSFFEKKRAYYDGVKSESAAKKDVKQQLIAKAEELKGSEQWRETTEAFKRLQQQWKNTGSALHRDEQALWKKFRAACDHFFEAKKKHYASLDEQHAENQKLKNTLLKKIKEHKPSGKKQEDLAAIKAFQDEWKAVGHVSMKAKEKINSEYFKLLDGMFNDLDMNEAEKAKVRFQSKIEGMASGRDAERSIQKEQNFIRGKKQQLQDEVNKLEGNIAMFFKHAKPNDPMFMEMNKKVDKIKRDIDKLVEQEKMLRQHAKQAQ